MSDTYANLEVNQITVHGLVSENLNIATKEYVDNSISTVVSAAPVYLDTLKEIADFLGSNGTEGSNIIEMLVEQSLVVDHLSSILSTGIQERVSSIDDLENTLTTEISIQSNELSNIVFTHRSEISKVEDTIDNLSIELSSEISSVDQELSTLQTSLQSSIENQVSNLSTLVTVDLSNKLDNGNFNIVTPYGILTQTYSYTHNDDSADALANFSSVFANTINTELISSLNTYAETSNISNTSTGDLIDQITVDSIIDSSNESNTFDLTVQYVINYSSEDVFGIWDTVYNSVNTNIESITFTDKTATIVNNYPTTPSVQQETNSTHVVERYRKTDEGNFQVNETDAFIYIGDYWRIRANNTSENKRLVFQYNPKQKTDIDFDSSWVTGVPLIN